MKRLHPFPASELKDLFDLDHAVNFGLLPPVVFSDEPEEELADYIDEYIMQEIIAEGATRNLPAFSRFLEIAALSNGGASWADRTRSTTAHTATPSMSGLR